MRLLIAKDRNALSPDLSSAIQPYNFFSTSAPASDTTLATSLTPKMGRVRSVDSISAMTTFMGSLMFLDPQLRFPHTLGYIPAMLRLSKERNNHYAIEDSKYFSVKLLGFFSSLSVAYLLRRRPVIICMNEGL